MKPAEQPEGLFVLALHLWLPVDSVYADAGPFLTTFCTNEITFKCSLFAPFYKVVALSRIPKLQTFFRSSVAQVTFSASFAVC